MVIETIGKIWKQLSPSLRTWVTRRTQHKFTASVAAIITNDRGEVLLLNHLLRPKSGWGLPGGFIGRAEQPEAALKRELAEETGIELKDVSMYRVRIMKRHIEFIFLAKGVG